MREYKVIKLLQEGLALPNSYSAKPSKPFIPDKYKNWVELKKLDRIK